MAAKKKPSKSPGSYASGIDLAEIERLLDFMAEHGLEEFEYARGDLQIRLKRPSTNSTGALSDAAHSSLPARTSPGVSAAAPAAQPPTAVASESAEDLHIVKSPIVGTFYDAPSPGSPSFVKPGDSVQVGQVLCIVEAMKLMNEIESDVAGELVRVFIENGQPVEYGEPLFGIRPLRST